MSNISVATIKSKNAATPPVVTDSNGLEIGKFCKAWIKCTIPGGVPAINSSFNVSSITDEGVGNTKITWTTGTFADTNYVCIGQQDCGGYNPHRRGVGLAVTSATLVLISTGYVTENASTYEDLPFSVAAFS